MIPSATTTRWPRHASGVLMSALTACLLAACGGGSGDTAAPSASNSASTSVSTGSTDGVKTALDATVRLPTPGYPASTVEAARFLTQATFGSTPEDVSQLMRNGYGAWIDNQFALPATSHRASWEAADAAIKLASAGASSAGQDQIWESFWKQAVTGPDQLRQRVAFALSEIFVISAVDSNVGDQPRAIAAWLDMLGSTGLTTYRELLEAVSLHPMMGLYLSHLRNQKADLATGRIPDQNYSREVMQLFSIGLVKLNVDGTPTLVDGKAVETYTPEDVAGLSRVFTGFSWACPGAPTSSNCFYNGSTGGAVTATNPDPDRAFKPMVGYPAFHSTEAKTFLGVTIPVQTTANPAASLRIALDTLAAHPNVGPFISQQLIQRLVISNPSPAYVAAVAAVFNNNGAGVRGDIKAVVKAILMHPEARLTRPVRIAKLREPVLRLSAYLRAFPHTSDTTSWKVGNTDSSSTSLGQTPLRSPSVFNFYRPGYVAPGTLSAAAGLVAPELQLVNETSVAGWVNFMRDNLSSGVGQSNGTVNGVVLNRRDLQRNWADELALATVPASLTARVTDRLLQGAATDALRSEISTAIGKITIPATGQTAIDNAKRARVNAAVLLTLASPEFLVQK